MKTHYSLPLLKLNNFFKLFALATFMLFSATLFVKAQPNFVPNKIPLLKTQNHNLGGQGMSGSLDPTFNGNGIRVDGFGNGTDEIYAAALQTDNKIVVVGRSSVGASFPAVVARYNSDGTLDSSFNGSGKVSLLNSMASANAVKIQNDGKIVVAGIVYNGQFSDFAVVRLNSNGTLDSTFGNNGKVSTPVTLRDDIAHGLAIQSNGKIVVVGTDENPNLSGFFEFALVRFNSDGSLDSSFGNGGKVTTTMPSSSNAHSVVIQSDGKIVVAGTSNNAAIVARYNSNGNLDSLFDGDGIATISNFGAYSVTLQSDGKIVAAGSPLFNTIKFAVFRFNSNGSLDNTFGGDGISVAPDNFDARVARFVVVDTNGKITAVGKGNSDGFVAVRYNSDGSFDSSFGNGGNISTPFDSANSFANAGILQADGKLVIAGYVDYSNGANDFAIARYNVDGSLDTAFENDGKLTNDIGEGVVYTMDAAVQADGKIVTVGRHYVAGDISDNWNFAVSRYNTDGSLDTTFDGDGKLSFGFFDNISDYANSVAIQPDGKIIVSGYIFNGSFTIFALIRLNPDGSLDTSFNGNGQVFTDVGASRDYATSVALQPNGKIVLGGYSESGNSSDFSVVRYNPDGSLDTSFDGDGIAITPIGDDDAQAYSVLVQADGKIILVGYSIVNGNANFALVRHNQDGSLDTSFGNGGKVLTLVGSNFSAAFSAALQTDGKIIAGGSSTNQSFAMARYNTNGTLDPGFGIGGTVITSINNFEQINDLAIQSDGKILATGETSMLSQVSNDYATLRYKTDGTLDTSWGIDGKVITDISGGEDRAKAIILDKSGNVIVAGQVGGLSGIVKYIGDATNLPTRTLFDFDGDGKTDIGIFRPAPGEWWYLRSSDNSAQAFQFGQSTDIIVPADYTGDGATDIAFFRDGQWFVLRSEDSSFYAFPFGQAGDIPAPGDFDGDGKDDPAIFRPSSGTWFYIKSSDGQVVITAFGADGDKPIVEDYDGDGMDDLAVYRPSVSEWYLQRSTAGFIGYSFGSPGNTTPVPADYTGDGKADVAFFNPNAPGGQINWFVLRSENESFYAFPFGAPGDIPVSGDYDGDGTADPAIYRPSNQNWFLLQTSNGFEQVQFGVPNDKPIPAAYIP